MLIAIHPLITHEPKILAQPLRTIARSLSAGQALAVAVLGFAGVAAFGITPNTAVDTPFVRTISRTLPLPAVADAEPADQRFWREERVQRGDTIGSLLARASVVDADAMAFLREASRSAP